MLVVYLSNRYIRVVEGDASGGKMNARSLYYTVDTRGCIVNGTVTDEEGFLELIQALWESNNLPRKGISLVLDSSQFTAKVTDVPVQKPKLMMEYISREFTDVGRISDPVYGYFPLSGPGDKKAKVQTVFAMAAPREFIKGYVRLFGSLGITIESIDCAPGVMHRLVGSLSQVRGATGIIQFVDDIMLINVLLVNGAFVYSSRNRLFSDPGTPGYSVEIARTVSNLLQFAQAQNITEKITNVYIAGLAKDDYGIYADSIRQVNGELMPDELNGEGDVVTGKEAGGTQTASNFALAIGGLIRTNPKTNIMAFAAKDPQKEAEKRKKRRILIPIAVIAGIMVLLTAVAGGRVFILSSGLKKAKAYNSREDVVKACEEYDSLSARIQTESQLKNNLTGLRNSVSAYPRVDSSTEQVVAGCAAGLVSAEISSYDSANGILSFNTSAANVEQIHQFIALLSQQEIFASVDYTGYTQDKEGLWNVKVNCTMADRQEEEDDTESN